MIEGFLLGATLVTVGLFGLACLAMGWCAGYSHRGAVEAGRRFGRLVAWHRRHRGRSLPGAVGAACGEVWAYLAPGRLPGDIVRLLAMWGLWPGR